MSSLAIVSQSVSQAFSPPINQVPSLNYKCTWTKGALFFEVRSRDVRREAKMRAVIIVSSFSVAELHSGRLGPFADE